MAMKLYPSRFCPPTVLPIRHNKPIKIAFCVRNFSSGALDADNSYKLVLEVKERLKNEYHELPVGKNGRDDESLIYWFLKDRSFSVDDAVKRLSKAIMQEEDEKLCVFQIEKALSKLPEGQEQILGIIDLRGFGTANADMNFLTFLFDVFYYYYPKRLAQVLFVEAPFVFKPLWQLAKPLLKQHASLVRFCTVETVRQEYFTEQTVPSIFRDENTQNCSEME